MPSSDTIFLSTTRLESPQFLRIYRPFQISSHTMGARPSVASSRSSRRGEMEKMRDRKDDILTGSGGKDRGILI
jgi:hypothetical protein